MIKFLKFPSAIVPFDSSIFIKRIYLDSTRADSLHTIAVYSSVSDKFIDSVNIGLTINQIEILFDKIYTAYTLNLTEMLDIERLVKDIKLND